MTDAIAKKLYPQGLGLQVERPQQGPLRTRFLLPPFSVLNTREEFWQRRRRAWLGLGIQSEVGRSDALTYDAITKAKQRYDTEGKAPKIGGAEVYTDGHLRAQIGMRMAGTSIFDPVLCELAYTWWAGAPGAEAGPEAYAPIVVDPFAGGSVRGIVASVLGCRYWGCELREEQVAGNTAQLGPATTGRYRPKWHCGDSATDLPLGPPADFIFSCPPYGNLEVYSDDPRDISNRGYGDFLATYQQIITAAAARLRPDRFACFVVANYRDKATGRMLDFVGDTVRAWEAAGCSYYNDVVLVNAVGTGAIRSNTNFVRGGRKVVKLHQNVLVFVKGDPRAAAARLPVFWDAGQQGEAGDG